MTEQGAITPVLWLLAFSEIFLLFAGIFLMTREYLANFFSSKVKPELKSFLTSILETAIVMIWLDPSPAELCTFFFLSFSCKKTGGALFGLGILFSTAMTLYGLNVFSLELPSLIRLAPTEKLGLDLLNHWGFAAGSLVWAIRMWYPEIHERIQSRFKRNSLDQSGRPSR